MRKVFEEERLREEGERENLKEERLRKERELVERERKLEELVERERKLEELVERVRKLEEQKKQAERTTSDETGGPIEDFVGDFNWWGEKVEPDNPSSDDLHR